METSQTFIVTRPEPSNRQIINLLAAIFTDTPVDQTAAELAYQHGHQPVVAALALADDRLVGCKLGYERKPSQFYSWLGGVHPDYRGRGIAAELMRRQHDWCRQNGYHTVRTQTYNQWREMLILNLRHGFDIIGTVQGARGLTIVLEKTL